MKTKMGRGGRLNNEKNMSQIRCVDNTYQQMYPNIVKARHIKLAFGDKTNTNYGKKDNEAASNRNDLDMFKPRRAAVTKSYDFTSNSGMRTRNQLGGSEAGNSSVISKMSQTSRSVVGSRFAMGGNSDLLRVGHQGVARPPQMRCYRPRM